MIRNFTIENLNETLRYNLINSNLNNNFECGPDFIKNNANEGEKVLSALIDELNTCESFDFSVAFITQSGIACLQNTLRFLDKSVKGRILTSDYLHFTDPKALEKILTNFKNIELKIYTKSPFHTKGYLFKQSNYYSMLIGSSNLTGNALTENQEWNLRIISAEHGQLLNKIKSEFDKIWKEAIPVTPDFIEKYIPLHKTALQKRKRIPIEIIDENSINETEEIGNPIISENLMQKEALRNLQAFRNAKKDKAICVAATGTGKTYLAAMDVRQVKPSKVLYLVNRETILRKSADSFKQILGNDIDIGFLTGKEKDYLHQYLFASVWTIVKPETLQKFSIKEFDYIIIDEVHHGGSKTYKTIIEYFEPKFLLGLTATPERTDDFNIFELFDYNQACNIRLHHALEEKLLCPFHYYGIADLTINNVEKDDHSLVSQLTTEERVKHIVKNINFYRNTSEPNRGLIFCSRKEEADKLSVLLNKKGFHTVALHSDNSDEQLREQRISELEDPNNPLEYIISVDILNEGIDIPSVNQVIFLRPTKSSIVYIQQLGRGLRKEENKSYLTVLDFIGNYENNYMIPIALFGDNSMNKDNLRNKLSKRSSYIPGSSTIDLDPISEKRILKAISNTNFQQKQILVEKYKYLKDQLNRIPSMMEFAESDSIDPINFMFHVVSKKDKETGSIQKSFTFNKTYLEFVCNYENIKNPLNSEEMTILKFISKELSSGIRIHEPLLLSKLISSKTISKTDFESLLKDNNIIIDKNDLSGMLNIINGDFYKKAEKKGEEKKRQYSTFDLVKFKNNEYIISEEFNSLLKSNPVFEKVLLDILEYCKYKWKTNYSKNITMNNLSLYQKYSRKDVCRLLNWGSNEESVMYGYKKDSKTNTCPIFVTYQKNKLDGSTTNYEDRFIDNYQFYWQSKDGKELEKDETLKYIKDSNNNGLWIPLFIMKSDNEGGNFYYMGNCSVKEIEQSSHQTAKGERPIVNVIFNVKPPVKDEILIYLEQDFSEEV